MNDDEARRLVEEIAHEADATAELPMPSGVRPSYPNRTAGGRGGAGGEEPGGAGEEARPPGSA